MVRFIGTLEAKNQFSRLIRGVARGQSFTITRHGVPVARLVPAEHADRGPAAAAIEQWMRLRKGNRLGVNLKPRDLIRAGRR